MDHLARMQSVLPATDFFPQKVDEPAIPTIVDLSHPEE
jgi:hypothetical protein